MKDLTSIKEQVENYYKAQKFFNLINIRLKIGFDRFSFIEVICDSTSYIILRDLAKITGDFSPVVLANDDETILISLCIYNGDE